MGPDDRSFEEMMDFVISAPQGEVCNESNCAKVVKENRKRITPFINYRWGKMKNVQAISIEIYLYLLSD